MKKFVLVLVTTLTYLICISGSLHASVQAGIFNPSGSTIEVRAKPDALTNGVLSNVVFTIRWSAGLSFSFGTITSDYGITTQGSQFTPGDGFTYQKFGSATGQTINWAAGSENVLMSVQITGGSGTGTFELSNALSGTQDDWYFELGGVSYTNTSTPFYQTSVSSVPLPVELTSFTALVNNNVVNLTWNTATEVNNYGFEVQRMAEGSNSSWTKAGFVQGAGNSNSPKSYSFTDNNPTGGTKLLYRLKQEDIDGSFEYSDTVGVTLEAQYALYQNYPNPFNPTTTIKFSIPQAARVSLTIYNILGQVVENLVNNEYLSAGFHSASFNGSRLASGMYIYRLHAGKYIQIKKMILLK